MRELTAILFKYRDAHEARESSDSRARIIANKLAETQSSNRMMYIFTEISEKLDNCVRHLFIAEPMSPVY